MNHKVLAIAVAAALTAPMAAQADIKFSGTIQAEIASTEKGDSGERKTVTSDALGTSHLNGGPNNIKFRFDEKLGNGLSAYGQYRSTFNTFTGSNVSTQEIFVGLKGANVHGQFGRMTGAYKKRLGQLDPFAATALQARGLGGGMTGSRMGGGAKAIKGEFGHNSYISNAMELGLNYGGFSLILQGAFDDNDDNGEDNAGLFEVRYAASNWSVFVAGAYNDFGDVTDSVTNVVTNDDDNDDNGSNLKAGGTVKFGGLSIAAQYEKADLGTFDGSQDAEYIFGSAQYSINNVSLGAWVGGYSSDVENEDALSFAVGAKYHFSKRTMLYAGYRDTDSDNNSRDDNTFTLGLRHSF